MMIAPLHLASPPIPQAGDTRSVSLLILAALITLVLAALRWTARRTRVLVVVTGTGVLLVFLAVLVLAYLITSGLF
ncbi:hypothetical protein [Nonomuraea sp. NPDC050783]|uniref:hypothetical protein n=1 Tax=Nonomuraea sp. NPDC050783 TaxID=3154634 RepID=UPI003466AFAA